MQVAAGMIEYQTGHLRAVRNVHPVHQLALREAFVELGSEKEKARLGGQTGWQACLAGRLLP